MKMIYLSVERLLFTQAFVFKNSIFKQPSSFQQSSCFRYFSLLTCNSQLGEPKNSFPNYASYRSKGHSKWQNIANTKRANDLRKSRVFHKIAVNVQTAVKEGGADMKVNSKLAALWEHAKGVNMPATTFNRAIDRALNIQMKPFTMEIMGPSGAYLIFEGEAENTYNFTSYVRKMIRKSKLPAKIVEGRIKQNFLVKGLIPISSTKDGKPVNLDIATDLAIEAGAEDVEEAENENNQKEIRLITEPEDFEKVKNVVERANFNTDMADVVYTPFEMVTLEPEELEKIKTFIQVLEEGEEIQRTHHNIVGLDS